MAGIVAVADAQDAGAAAYHVYSCRTPAGESAPADGWSPSRTGVYTYAENTCAQPGGALVAALGDQTARTANTAQATWAFTAPAGESITAATLWRAGDADGGAALDATFQFWLAGSSPTDVFEECLYALGCSARGNAAAPTSAENRVVVPAPNLGSRLYVSANCGGVNEYNCKEGQGDSNNYAAVIRVFAADMTLEQTQGPSVGSVSGELATAAGVSGTSDVAFAASDPGSGVYEAIFSLDGQVVQRTVLDEDGGRCRDVGQTTDGLPAFLYVQPCPASLSADAGLDTTRFANGPHHLVVSVSDAAGNQAVVLDRNIIIENPLPSAASGAPAPASVSAGAPNGANASSAATLTVAWKGVRGTRATAAHRRGETVQGTLTAPGGAPISGARIEVSQTPSYLGARPAAMPALITGADGSFTLALPGGGDSRTLQFSYRASTGEATPAVSRTLSLTVGATLTLSVSPRVSAVGGRIVFRGRLLGGPVPAGGKLLVLEARSPGGRWIEFHVARSDSRGRYTASYRFRFPGPHTYQFRAVCEPEADYPYGAGASRVVSVYEA